MKKKLLVLVTILTFTLSVTSCGAEDVDSTTNEVTSTEQIEDSSEVLATEDINLYNESTERTSAPDGTYVIGDTVTLSGIDDKNNIVMFEVTLTGYEAVYDEINEENAVAIFYTIHNIGENELLFTNTQWDIYADNYSVDKTSIMSLDSSSLSGASLSTGRMYEGCVCASIDPYQVGTIEIECLNATWCVQKDNIKVSEANSAVIENIPETTITEAEFDIDGTTVDYTELSGEFTEVYSETTLSMSMYSSLESDGSIGTFTLVDSTGISLEGTLYFLGANQIQAVCNNGLDIMTFTVGSGNTVTIGAPNLSYMDGLTVTMTTKYES